MTNSDLIYGLKGTWQNSEGFGGELGFESGSDIMYTTEDTTTSLTRVFGHVNMYGESSYSITPYALLGAGYEFLSTNIKGDPDQGFIDAGAGFSYNLFPYMNLNFEVRALYKLDSEDIDYTGNIGFAVAFDEHFRFNQDGYPLVPKVHYEEALGIME
jgi:OOP family OmpA-OmpF porin